MPNEKVTSDEEPLTDEHLEEVSGGTDRFNGKYLVQGVTHTHTEDSEAGDAGGFADKLKIRE